MADFGERAAAVRAVWDVLNSGESEPAPAPRSRHSEHAYSTACRICRGETRHIARMAVDAAYPHIAAEVLRRAGDDLLTGHYDIADACYRRASQYEDEAKDKATAVEGAAVATTDHDGEAS